MVVKSDSKKEMVTMNEKVKKFLDEQKANEMKERQKHLVELGLYEKEYAPLMGYGYIDGESERIGFPVGEGCKEGDTIQIEYKGVICSAKVDWIIADGQDEYPCSEGAYQRYRKIPIDITDEEYSELKKYIKQGKGNTEENTISSMLKGIGIFIYIYLNVEKGSSKVNEIHK